MRQIGGNSKKGEQLREILNKASRCFGIEGLPLPDKALSGLLSLTKRLGMADSVKILLDGFLV